MMQGSAPGGGGRALLLDHSGPYLGDTAHLPSVCVCVCVCIYLDMPQVLSDGPSLTLPVSLGTPSGQPKCGWTNTSSTIMLPGHSPWRGPLESKWPSWLICAESSSQARCERTPTGLCAQLVARLGLFSPCVPSCSRPLPGTGPWATLAG